MVVPDLEKFARAYVSFLDGNQACSDQLSTYDATASKLNPTERLNALFGKNISVETPSNRHLKGEKVKTLANRISRNPHQHRFIYDFYTLSELLSHAGFVRVRRLEFRKGECPDLEKLDIEGRKFESLYVEAYKP